MDHPNMHTYLGEELLLNQCQLAANVRDALPPGPATATNDGQISKLDQKTEVWPSKLIDTFRYRQAPVFNQEEIKKLNQTYNRKIDEINDKNTQKQNKNQPKTIYFYINGCATTPGNRFWFLASETN